MPGKSTSDAPVVEAAPAVEAARQWHRDLRYTVRTAKRHAKALSDNSHGGVPDTPRRPS